MAHIPDGVLSLPVLAAGGIASAAALGFALKRLGPDDIPRTAVLASVFFVASLVTIPVGPTAVHPLLNGLMGLVLGWAAVPAIAVGLFLQMVFFGFGGLTAYGVNLANIALPALACGLAFRGWLAGSPTPARAGLVGAAAAVTGVALTGMMVSLALALSSSAYADAAQLVMATYIPLMIGEAAVTGAIAAFLWRVAPEMIGAAR